MSNRYDLVVIGGGSGGLTAATIAAKLRARVLLVDRAQLGGDCLHDGCVPSKALIASARLAHQMRRAREYGLESDAVRVSFRSVLERIRAIQATIGEHESVAAMRAAGVDVLLGGARFVDPRTIEVGGETRVRADRVIIATGSRPVTPPIPGLADAGFLDYVSLWKLDALPPRIAVIGGGPVGVEMGQALHRLGAKVTLVQSAPRLLMREEAEIAESLLRVFEKEAIDVRLGAELERVEGAGGKKIVSFRRGESVDAVEVDAIFVAVGRRANVEALALDKAGVAANDRGIIVDDRLRTSQPHIWAIGDCAGGPQFTHWAEYEGRVAARNALFAGSEKRSMKLVPWVTFTDPEVARVGLTEAEAKEQHPRAHAHRWDFARLDRALTEGEPGGFIKVVVDESERVLGAHIIGHHAGEALAEWVLAMRHRLRLSDVGGAIHVYPTITRINRRVADMPFFEHGVPGWLVRLAARFKPLPSGRR
jgi:pyruvate/2-oxoglutarate dehydrogenase complex dihydrolipoamide dehydrogenase (E3) component